MIRSVFWFHNIFTPWSLGADVILQGFAIAINFSTFAVLCLFYAESVYKHLKRWRSFRTYVKVAFIISDTLSIGLILLPSLIIGIAFIYDAVNEKTVAHVQYTVIVFTGGFYLFLAIFVGYYGYFLSILIPPDTVSKISFLKNKKVVLGTTILLSICFLSRSIVDLLTPYGFNINIDDPVMFTTATKIVTIILFLLWEIIPTVTVIILFWEIPEKVPMRPYIVNPIDFSVNQESYLSEADVDWAQPYENRGSKYSFEDRYMPYKTGNRDLNI
eukprot:TRINITY_DN1835_c0_g1_i2.p1 TRINITY_DN1835_c0_g1~~TRINITY_DN1835_c0_g1_i2.p1  ORF type:complete len:272 (+),score=32.72 TRINITY_DN1835_c0_g1_i2:514-1329(+)